MDCTLISDYIAIKKKLSYGIDANCKIEKIKKKSLLGAASDLTIAHNALPSYAQCTPAPTTDSCTYCIDCSSSTNTCQYIEIVNFPNPDLTVEKGRTTYCISTKDDNIKIHFTGNIYSTVPAPLFAVDVTLATVDNTTTTIQYASLLDYQALDNLYSFDVYIPNDLFMNVGTIAVYYTLTDGINFYYTMTSVNVNNDTFCIE